MTKYSATFEMNPGQYTPLREREDGQGYEPQFIEAASLEEAAPLAQALYRREPWTGMGNTSEPTSILLVGDDFSVGSFDFATLECAGTESFAFMDLMGDDGAE